MIVFIIGTLVILAGLLIFIQMGGGIGFPWVQFYVKGAESGFKFGELNLLRRVSVENQLKNPTSLFWSERQLDRCLRGTIIKFRSQGREKEDGTAVFLNKLFDFRKRVEFNLPKYRLGISSSRNITPRQIIKVTFPGGGVFLAQVVENMRRYLAISYPKGKALPPGFTWHGRAINVYFWRKEDAGYFFESRVVGDYLDRQYPILHIAHSDNLVRAQKRGSVRVAISCPVNIYPLRMISQANETVEAGTGYRGRMLDISEDGAAIIVGGKAKPGLPIKIQFNLSDNLLVMCGTVKGVNYNQKNNTSILHIQAVHPSPAMKNTILTFVYGIFREPDVRPEKKAGPSKAAAQSIAKA